MQRLLASVFVVGLLAVAAGCGTTDDESPPAPADESREATEQGDDGKSAGSGKTGEPPPEDEAQANAYEVARENCADAGLKEVAKEFGTRQNEVAAAEAYGEALSTPEFFASKSTGCLAGLLE